MGYQALLFCPDEKTARTVTQVLSELDFAVTPCTEPFAAVKKLMGEHFDAVVVDCDNEQNATLLFKSARNTTSNQSSLAVAVVEGQAGVAKAFRIGANLVLTKPINVEQAKGTLRVARGLLRKNESGKSATAAASPKTASQNQSAVQESKRPAEPVAARPRESAPAFEVPEPDADILEIPGDEIAAPYLPAAVAQTSASQQYDRSVPAASSAIPTFTPTASATGSASAPAAAREPEPSVSTESRVSIPTIESVQVADESAVSNEGTAAPSPMFTFGGAVSSETKSSGRGGKKALVAVAAVAVIAALGYWAWMEWGHSSGKSDVADQAAATAVSIPAPAKESSSVARTAPAPVRTTSPESASTEAVEKTKGSANTQLTTGSAAEHASKNAGTDLAKPSPSAVSAKNIVAEKAEPEPIVVKHETSKPAKKVVADAPAPSMSGIAAAGSAEALPDLMAGQSQAPAPVLQTLSVSQGVSQGLLLKKVQPNYPANAMKMRVEGAVQLLATISKSGDISVVKILTGDSQLSRAAVDAVKQWKYKPYLLNGSPVEIQTQITVNFKLPR